MPRLKQYRLSLPHLSEADAARVSHLVIQVRKKIQIGEKVILSILLRIELTLGVLYCGQKKDIMSVLV